LVRSPKVIARKIIKEVTSMQKKTISLCLIFFCVLLLLSCDGKSGARFVWKKLLMSCAQNDLLGKDVLYFGLSGGIEPGSYFRKNIKGSFGIGYTFDAFGFDEQLKSSLINKGVESSCGGTGTFQSKFSPSLSLGNLIPVLNAAAKADFVKGRKVVMSVKGWRWDNLIVSAFEAEIRRGAVNRDVLRDLQNTRYVVVRGLYVLGLKAEVEFADSVSGEMEAKYKSGTEVGVGLKANWASDKKLEIVSDKGFYIAGEIWEMTTSGFAGPGPIVIKKITNLDEAVVE
jgi:hypothetical protein